MPYNIWKCKQCKEPIRHKEKASYLSLEDVSKEEFDSYCDNVNKLPREHKCQTPIT